MVFRLIILSFLFLSITESYAQTSQPIASQNNRFSFPESIVCATYGSNNEIIINTTTLECDAMRACVVDFRYDASEGFGKKPDPANPGAFVDDPDNLRSFEDGAVIPYTFSEAGNFNIAIVIGAGVNNFDQLVQPLTVLPASPPDFDVYNCSGNEVRVEITDTNFPLFLVDYDNDGTAETQAGPGMVSPGFTYAPAQTQAVISVTPDYASCSSSSETVELVNGPLPASHEISLLQVTGAGEIDLELRNVQDNILYELERSTNSTTGFSPLQNFTEQTELSDITVNTQQDFYCYRFAARDLCANQRFPGNTICSHKLDVAALDGFNQVNWTTALPGAGTLSLRRNNTEITTGLAATGTYDDNSVICGSEYCYSFITEYSNNIQSISAPVCRIAKSSQAPPVITEVATAIEDGRVRLQWQTNPDFGPITYTIHRPPTNVRVPFTQTTDDFLIDETYEPFQGVCYEISYADACGNNSVRSAPVCPIELKATLNETDNSVTLTWSAYNGWSAGLAHYVIEKYNTDGALVSSVETAQTNYTDAADAPGQIFTYRVLAVPNDTDVPQPSISNRETIIKSLRLYHPTAFVPESAIGPNRTFSVRGVEEYITTYELRVFNRWGEMMFYSEDMNNGWDGTFKGARMPEGTYVFRSRVSDTAGRTFDYSGSVVLFRK